MQFNTGTRNLVGEVRNLLNDPTTNTTEQYPIQEVKDAINDVYLELRDVMRQFDQGHGAKRTYTDSVTDQMFYQYPDDWVRTLEIELSTAGDDLSTLSVPYSDVVFLTPMDEETALRSHVQGYIDSPKYYFHHDLHFGIASPVYTGGTNGLRMTYEASTLELSLDGDEPDLPRPHQVLIAYKAAISLGMRHGLDVDDLARLAVAKEVRFMKAVQDVFEDMDDQIVVSGLWDDNRLTKAGTITKL